MEKTNHFLIRTGMTVLCLLMFAIGLKAQNRTVTGKVVDQVGNPLVGVNVIEKGTMNGTMTDLDGLFTITVAPSSLLQFSCISYISEELLPGEGPVNVTLRDDTTQLDDVVVIGYGTARRKDLTGSVIQIRPDNMVADNPKTVQDVLRNAAGLNVGYDASAKGGGSLSVRGQRSVYTDGGHNDPLLILDGMMFYGELSEINPDDIEQIDVLKDASSAAIFGAKAANGVILITTKKGKVGKPVINLSATVGAMTLADFWHRWNTQDEYLTHYKDWKEVYTNGYNAETGQWEAYQTGPIASQPGYYSNPEQLPSGVSLDQWRGYTTNESGEPDLSIWARRLGFNPGSNTLANLLAGKITNWEDISLRTGLTQDYNASVSGASENMNYYLSFGYMNNHGVRKFDDYQTYRANMKLHTNVTKWLELGANVNFQQRTDGEIGFNDDDQMRQSIFADYKDEDGNFVQYPLDGSYSQRGYNYDFERQYLDLEKGYTVFNTIFDAKIKLPFNITYTFNISPRYQFFYDRYFMSADRPGSVATDRGVNREQAKRFDWSLNNTLAWDYFFASKHHVTLTLGQEAEDRRYWSDRIEARNILPSDALGFHNTQNGSKDASTFKTNDTHQSADALFARAFYSYDDRYMITGTIRRDGYSAFGYSNPYAIFPSFGVAWTFTNESFWNWDAMDYGKIRFSYGKNGNRSLANPYVALANLYPGGGKTNGYIQSNGSMEEVKYLMIERLANPGLQWEKTTSMNLGLDFSFFQGRINGSIEGYLMQTHDMIMNKKIPSITGFDSITTNLGQVDNNGFEITLNTVNVRNPNFTWESSFSFSYNKNMIKHLYYEYEDILDENGNVTGQKETDDTTNGWFIGQPIGVIWNYEVTGIWQKDEWEEAAKFGQVPGDPKVANHYTADDVVNADGTVTPQFNNNDKVFQGTGAAPVRWSLRNDFTLFKDLTLTVNMYSKMGQKKTTTRYLNIDDDGGHMAYQLATLRKKTYWTVDHPTDWQGRIDAMGPTGAQRPAALIDGSFIRISNISLAYTLPSKFVKALDMSRIKVFATVGNPCMIKFDKHWQYGDIEAEGLSVRTYQMGVNLTF